MKNHFGKYEYFWDTKCDVCWLLYRNSANGRLDNLYLIRRGCGSQLEADEAHCAAKKSSGVW